VGSGFAAQLRRCLRATDRGGRRIQMPPPYPLQRLRELQEQKRGPPMLLSHVVAEVRRAGLRPPAPSACLPLKLPTARYPGQTSSWPQFPSIPGGLHTWDPHLDAEDLIQTKAPKAAPYPSVRNTSTAYSYNYSALGVRPLP